MIWLLVAVVIVTALLFPQDVASSISSFYVAWIFIPAFFSFTIGTILESMNLGILKKYALNIKFGNFGFSVSVTLFWFLILIIRFLLLH